MQARIQASSTRLACHAREEAPTAGNAVMSRSGFEASNAFILQDMSAIFRDSEFQQVASSLLLAQPSWFRGGFQLLDKTANAGVLVPRKICLSSNPQPSQFYTALILETQRDPSSPEDPSFWTNLLRPASPQAMHAIATGAQGGGGGVEQ